MFGNWANASMALHRLEGMEVRLQDAIKRANQIFPVLNKLPGVTINSIPGGTNICNLNLSKEIDGKKMQATLSKEFGIVMPPPNENNHTYLTMNETLLYQDPDYVINAFKRSI
jgi:threonine aldolase